MPVFDDNGPSLSSNTGNPLKKRININMRKLYFSLCALAVLAILAGCVGSTAKKSNTNIRLKSCSVGGSQAQCGTLRVYENRAAQSGRMIDLNIVVIKASHDDPAPDPIFYLA